MKMRFSVGAGQGLRIDQVVDFVRTAEECGFSQVTFPDMPAGNRDVQVLLTLTALNTKRIHMGQGVTDPLTYHPSVVANATATVNELSGGRAFVGLGAGGRYGKSMKPVPLQDLRDAVLFLKDYSSGREAIWKGAKMHSEWVRQPLRVVLAVDGPRACQMAGELADGIMFLGVHPEYVKWRRELLQQGAQKAGRDLSKVEVFSRTIVYPARSREEAHYEVRPYIAGFEYISRALTSDVPANKDLRRRLEKADPGVVEQVLADYAAYQSARAKGDPRPWSDIVSQRTLDFFCIVGPENDICQRIEELGRLGVNNITTMLSTIRKPQDLMHRISDHIMPHFRN